MAEAVDGPRDDGAPREERTPDLLPAPARRPETLPERAQDAPSAELGFPTGAQPPSTFAPRFRMITGALVGVAIGALAATTVLLMSGRPAAGPAWSAWQPSKDSTTDGADEIAKHVGGRYRLPTGDQLVLVTGGPLRVAGLDIPVRIALEERAGASTATGSGSGGSILGGTGSSSSSPSLSEVKGRAVLYQLCGLGPRCAISKGKPSDERGLLLRREALELALYSFQYLGGVTNVVALLPPAPGKKPENALFFRRSDYESALGRPLTATLPSPPPALNTLPASPEADLIQRLTRDRVFRYSFQQSQDLSALLVLAKQSG
ncbi:MAG: hypothetical protein QOJ97_3026 [Solirubrobacteraceae bacterium]|nr:hypothetical protein [Solirubrobacteraceae bacterium]